MDISDECVEIVDESIIQIDEPSSRLPRSRVPANVFLLAGLTTVVLATSGAIWRRAWESQHFVTTRGHLTTELYIFKRFYWTDQGGARHSKKLGYLSSPGNEFEVVYRKDRPSDGWIKSSLPSLIMSLLIILDFAGCLLLGTGVCLHLVISAKRKRVLSPGIDERKRHDPLRRS